VRDDEGIDASRPGGAVVRQDALLERHVDEQVLEIVGGLGQGGDLGGQNGEFAKPGELELRRVEDADHSWHLLRPER